MTDDPAPVKADEDHKPESIDQSEEAQRIKEILERARQNVKRLAKQEFAGEQISRELLNLRLRAADAD